MTNSVKLSTIDVAKDVLKEYGGAMRFEYREVSDGISIDAVYGDIGEVVIPDMIDGKPVREISAYAFSGKDINPDDGDGIEFRLAGDVLKSVTLPDTLEKIGELCFYQCYDLKSISLPNTAIEIGSDAFMNCKKLDTLFIRGSVKEPSSLRQILLQRTSATDVWFDDAAIHFSEYSEKYDLIGPAHIFELNIEGEGFRARKCFDGDVFDVGMYDTVFEKAKDTEDEKTLCKTAALRLSRPAGLTDEIKESYLDYLLSHMDVYLDDVIKHRDLSLIEGLGREGFLSDETVAIALKKMTAARWTEGVAKLLAWKSEWGKCNLCVM